MKNSKMIIGISGARGSFSEEAAEHYTQSNKIKNYTLDYLIGVENVLGYLEAGKIDLGIFPLENSNGGIVMEAVEAMSRHNFKIEKIFEIDIKHFLLALPGKNPGEVSRIVSHSQALKQCRIYLKRKWPNTELMEYSDTASAAKDLSRGALPENSAVIAPGVCSQLYKLDVLEEGVQDLKFNFTTFITASKNEKNE